MSSQLTRMLQPLLSLFLKAIVLLSGSVVIITTGCSRSSTPSRLVISVPSTLEKLSTSKAEIFIINLRTSVTDSKPILKEYKPEDLGLEYSTSYTLVIDEDIPASDSLLVQFLGVYEDMDTEKISFYYGDATVNSKVGGDITADIKTTLFQENSSAETQIIGQWVTSVSGSKGHGPTDKVAVKFKPPNSKPSMTVTVQEMFDGWFNFFAIDGVPFEFELMTSKTIISGLSVSALNSTVSSSPTDLMKVVTPDVFYYKEDCGGGCTATARDLDGGEIFYGFFGPAKSSLASKRVCYPASGSAHANLYKSNSLTTLLPWNADAIDATSISRSNGGVAIASCSTNPFYNEIHFNAGTFSDGIHSASPFSGPFKRNSHTFISNDYCNREDLAAGCFDATSNQVTIKATFIPQVFSMNDSIDGVTLFGNIEPNCVTDDECQQQHDKYRSDLSDGYNCAEFAKNAMNVQRVYTYGTAPLTGDTFSDTFNLSIPADHQLMAFLCPFRVTSTGEKEYFQSAAELRNIGNWGSQPYSEAEYFSTPYQNLTLSDLTTETDLNYGAGASIDGSVHARTYPLSANNLTLGGTINVYNHHALFIRANTLNILASTIISANGEDGSSAKGGDGGSGGGGAGDSIADCGSSGMGGTGYDGMGGSTPGGFGTANLYNDLSFSDYGFGGPGGNGADGTTSGGGPIDGAGGGGAGSAGPTGACLIGAGGGGGGLIVIYANTITGGAASLEARGGMGYGEGGGGGGGVIWVAARSYNGLSTTDVSGGPSLSTGSPGMPGIARIFQIHPDNTLTERSFLDSW